MDRMKKILVRSFLICLGVFAVAAACLYFSLESLIEDNIFPIACKQLGTDVSGEVRDIGISEADLASIRIGSPENPFIEIDSIRIDYSIEAILEKRQVEKVIVGGLKIHAAYKDGRLSLPGFDIRKFSRPKSEKSTEDNTENNDSGEKPFTVKSCGIHDSVMVLETDGGRKFVVPFEAEVSLLGSEGRFYQVSLDIFPRDEKISVSGNFDIKGGGGLCSIRTDGLDLAKFADFIDDVEGLQKVSGNADVDFAYDIPSGNFSFKSKISKLLVDGDKFKLRNSQDAFGAEIPLYLEASKIGRRISFFFNRISAVSPLNVELGMDENPSRLEILEDSLVLESSARLKFDDGLPQSFGLPFKLDSDKEFTLKLSAESDFRKNWKFMLNTVMPSDAIKINGASNGSHHGTFTPALLNVRGEGMGGSGNAKFAFKLSEIEFKQADLHLKMPAFEAFADVSLKNLLPEVKAYAKFADSLIEAKGAKAEKVSAVIPFRWPFPSISSVKMKPRKDDMGSLDIGSIMLGDFYLGSLSTSIYQDNLSYILAGKYQSAFPDFAFDTCITAGNGANSGFAVRADMKLVEPEKRKTLNPSAVSKKLTDIDIEGNYDVDISFSSERGKISGVFDSRLRDGSASSANGKTSIEGIDMDLKIDDFQGMKSGPSQMLKFKRLAMGSIIMSDGIVMFQVESPKKLFIEKTASSWCSGRVYSHSMRLRAGVREFDFVLYCDRVNPAEVLTQINAAGATGTGAVSGRIPIRLYKDDLVISDGFLYSTPGRGGTMSLDKLQMLSSGETYVSIAQESLKSFSYDWFSMYMNSKDENLEINLKMNGKPNEKLPFGFDIAKGGLYRTEDSNIKATFQGILFEINFHLPLSRIMPYSHMDMSK